jgi:hypothetical protein
MVIHWFLQLCVDHSRVRQVECVHRDQEVVSDRGQQVADKVMMDSRLVMVERQLSMERLALSLVLWSELLHLGFQVYRAN